MPLHNYTEPYVPNPDDPLAMKAYLAERGQLHAIGQAREPYAAAEVCQHAFAYDTGVCMACGVSVASARLASAKPPVNEPIDPAGWDKLRAAFDKCDRGLEESRDFLKRQGVPRVEITPTLEVAALTILHGSRERALDAWKAEHLAARAKRNTDRNPLTPPKPGEAEAREKRYQAQRAEIDRRDALTAAMSRPLAAEKSMRAQILRREDDI